MEYSPECREELQALNKRLQIVREVGAGILNMPDAFDSFEKRQELDVRLRDEQPDLAQGIMSILGRMTKLLDDGF